MDVVLITDKNYFDYAMVTVKSLLAHTTSPIEVNVILTFEKESLQVELEQAIKKKYPHAQFKFLTFNLEKLAHIKPKNHVSLAAYIKMYLPELFKDKNQMIFLDSDLLITEDIKNLWAYFKEDFTLAAVENPEYTQDFQLLLR